MVSETKSLQKAAGKLPPHSVEAEEAVLGAILLNQSEAMNRVVEILKPESFYSPRNKLIYEAMFNMFNQNKPIDTLSVAEYFNAKNSLDAIGGREYLNDLVIDTILTSNIEYYANIIKESATKRELINAGSLIIEETFKNPESAISLELAEKMIFEISQNKSQAQLTTISSILPEAFDQLEFKFNNKGTYTGIPSDFYDLDTLTAGFQKSDLIILAARPSMGKTAFALNIAQNVSIRHKIPVAIFSLEMSKSQLVQRILCSEAEVDAQRVRTGDIQPNDWQKLTECIDKLHMSPLYIDDTAGVSVSDIRAQCRRLKMQRPDLGMVIIDYLQLIDDRSSSDRIQQISAISRSLKSLARELNVPVIALSQLSRKVEERTDKRPMLSDLRESGAIEQDADIVMFIHREEYYDKDNPNLKNKAKIIIAKQRNGPTGDVNLLFHGGTTKFKNPVKAE